MSEQIRREFTLAYPIEKVKTAIEDAASTSIGSIQIKDRNPAFNSYSLSLVNNLYVLPATVTLRSVGEAETHFELSAIPGPHLTRMVNFTTDLIEVFLKKVGDFASGRLISKSQSVEETKAAAKKQDNAILFFVAIIAVAVAAVGGLIWLMDKK